VVGSIDNAGTLLANANLGLTSLTNSGVATLNALFRSTGDVTNAGTLTVAPASNAEVMGNLTNTGTLNVGGTLLVDGAATNAAGATATLAAGSQTILGSLTNAGTWTADGTLGVTGNANNSGTLILNAGSVPTLGSLTNSGTATVNDVIAVQGLVNNSGTLTLGNGATATFGALTNSGTITTPAFLTVNGAYTQNAGSLNAGGGLYTGTLSGTGGSINLGGSTYTLNQTADGTYSGSVIGGGTVNKYGTGTLTLNGAADSFAPSTLNIYTGGVTVTTAGLLDNALNVLIDTPGTLTLLADQTIHDLTGGGTLNVGSNTLHLTDGGALTARSTAMVRSWWVRATCGQQQCHHQHADAQSGQHSDGGFDGQPQHHQPQRRGQHAGPVGHGHRHHGNRDQWRRAASGQWRRSGAAGGKRGDAEQPEHLCERRRCADRQWHDHGQCHRGRDQRGHGGAG
jgi:hypothetical protein